MSRDSNFQNVVISHLKELAQRKRTAAETALATESTALEIRDAVVGINTTLNDNTNTLLTSIRDENVAQSALISSTNTLLTDIRTELVDLNSAGQITNLELVSVNSELDNIEASLFNIILNDSSFYTDVRNSQSSIVTLLNSINGLSSATVGNTGTISARVQTLITQTDQVEAILGSINTTLINNGNTNVAELQALNTLLLSIDADTTAINTSLTMLISEHDQTQVLIGASNTLLTAIATSSGDINTKLNRTNQTHTLTAGTNIDVPAGFKSVFIECLTGVTTLTFLDGTSFQLSETGLKTVVYNGEEILGTNGILPSIIISGGTWQWTGQSTLTV